jgi:phosphoribosylanthranilate isomerase
MSDVVEIKICGFTRVDDAAAAAELGVDYLGLVFAPSRRRVSLEMAKEMHLALGGRVPLIGVFVDPSMDEVRRAADAAGLSGVQVHGVAPGPRGGLSSLQWWCGVRMRDGDAAESIAPGEWDLLLLDTWVDGEAGGTGRSFDWNASRGRVVGWRGERGMPRLGVAGGLTPENVATAIGLLRPDVVDVSSGVEAAPGLKDRRRMKEFVQAARAAGSAG